MKLPSKLTVARRFVQLSVVVAMLCLPAMARYSSYVNSSAIDRHLERWQGSLQGQWLDAIDSTVRLLPGTEVEHGMVSSRAPEGVLAYTKGIGGGPWSLELGPLSISDPLVVAEHIAATKTLLIPLMVGAVIPLLATLLFGRVYCSWLCPAGLLFEMTDKVRTGIRRLGVKPREARFNRKTKYTLLGAGLILAVVLSTPVLGAIYPPAVIGREIHNFVFTLFDRAEYGRSGWSAEGLSWMVLALAAVSMFEVLMSRRWWCRYMCPGGALYSLVGSARPVRVKLDPTTCTECTHCTKVCPMGLNPMRGEMGRECDSCGLCIAACSEGSLGYGFGLASLPPSEKSQTTRSYSE